MLKIHLDHILKLNLNSVKIMSYISGNNAHRRNMSLVTKTWVTWFWFCEFFLTISYHRVGQEFTSCRHYDDVIMSTMASQITSPTVVYSTLYSDADQRKHQGSASLAFVWGIHRGPVNSPHKGPVKLGLYFLRPLADADFHTGRRRRTAAASVFQRKLRRA